MLSWCMKILYFVLILVEILKCWPLVHKMERLRYFLICCSKLFLISIIKNLNSRSSTVHHIRSGNGGVFILYVYIMFRVGHTEALRMFNVGHSHNFIMLRWNFRLGHSHSLYVRWIHIFSSLPVNNVKMLVKWKCS